MADIAELPKSTLYDVKLKLRYDYDDVVAGGRQVVRVMPRHLPGIQRVIAETLSVSPNPAERWDNIDFFQNNTTTIVYRGAHNDLELNMTARINVERTSDQPAGSTLEVLRTEIDNCRSLKPQSPHHFLQRSQRIHLDTSITDYARTVCDSDDTREIAWNLCKAIHADFAYLPGATDVGTTALEAFEQKAGVCQDFAHIMISGLRGLGIPAGYVSGLIRTTPPPGRPRLEGADAMHAWVRAWCGEHTGWLEFDPTNAVTAGRDHIVIAYGRDYDDVSPIIGVLRSAGGQKATQSVDVLPLDQSVD